MRGLVLIAGLSLFGCLPAGSAAADDSQNPTSAEAFYGRAYAYDRKGDNDRAIADYTRAIELKPEFVAALYNRANIYAKKGDNDRALEGYEACPCDQPRPCGGVYWPWRLFILKNMTTPAPSRSIARRFHLIRIFSSLSQGAGELYLAKHDYDRAIADLTKALAINPNNSYSRAGISAGATGTSAGASAGAR